VLLRSCELLRAQGQSTGFAVVGTSESGAQCAGTRRVYDEPADERRVELDLAGVHLGVHDPARDDASPLSSFLTVGFAPLGERPFRLLFFGRTLSSVGDAIVPVAVTFAVLDLGDATDLGLVLGSSSAARVIFLVAGGVWADRLPRQLVMMAADVVRAGVQALIALAFFTESIAIWQLAAGAAFFGAASAFFNPASTGLVPQLVSRERLQEANALLGLARSVIEVAGPVVSGLLVATLGFGVVFAVDAASFVASFLCLAAMRLPRSIARGERKRMLTEAIDGLRIVRQRRWIVAGLACDLLFNLALAAYFVLGPAVFEEHFDGARDWGIAMSAAAVGGLLGGLIVLRFRPSRRRTGYPWPYCR
jgi:MFS family permease